MPLVESDHRGEIPAGRVARHEDQPRITAVIGNMLHNPCRRGRRIGHTVGNLHARHQPVLHAHDGKALAAQRLGNLAPASFESSAVKPDDGREALPAGRTAEIQPAERVDVSVARSLAVGDIPHDATGAVLRPKGRGEEQLHGQQPEKSFHGSESFAKIKVGKFPQKTLPL